jgi:predicted O-methyltransferase YrrM
MPWYGYHSYLNDYITEKNCRKIMEVGVYNGENALRMVKTAIKHSPPSEVQYFGFDYFSYYSTDVLSRKLGRTGCIFKLFEGDTLETLPKIVNLLPKMDLIFIDGGKSFKVAHSDWENSRVLMHEKTGLFVHNVDFRGVNRMINHIPLDEYNVKIFYASSEGSVAQITKK